jgi:4-hydroxy-3-polyprenylbenzoate decarboxylase
MGLMSLAKVIVVVDEGIDVRNVAGDVVVRARQHRPERDVRFSKGPVDDLDHAAQNPSFGSKMGIDGTRKWAEEGFTRRWPEMIEMDAEVKAHVDGIWGRLGIEPID